MLLMNKCVECLPNIVYAFWYLFWWREKMYFFDWDCCVIQTINLLLFRAIAQNNWMSVDLKQRHYLRIMHTLHRRHVTYWIKPNPRSDESLELKQCSNGFLLRGLDQQQPDMFSSQDERSNKCTSWWHFWWNWKPKGSKSTRSFSMTSTTKRTFSIFFPYLSLVTIYYFLSTL